MPGTASVGIGGQIPLIVWEVSSHRWKHQFLNEARRLKWGRPFFLSQEES